MSLEHKARIRMTLEGDLIRRLIAITDKKGIRANEVINLLIEQYLIENENNDPESKS